MWTYRKIFALVTLVYFALTFVFVKGTPSVDTSLPEIKQTIQALYAQDSSGLSTTYSLFGYLLGTAGATSDDAATVYQAILLVCLSLAFIWLLRQTYAKETPRVRDVFYESQYPLVQFSGVLIVVALQMLPLIIANALFEVTYGAGLLVTGIEQFLWFTAFFLLVLLSFYMLTSSVFALYIVTLPGMTPLKALRSARELVRFRRWTIMRKVLFLPFGLLVCAGIVLIPLIAYATATADIVFLALTAISLPLIHTYIYTLYRELL
jgi:hypothetical protein